MIVIPLAITMLKLATGRHCPWDMTNFGGSVAYQRLLEALPAGVKPGQCFPTGHAATGYLWIVWAVAHCDRQVCDGQDSGLLRD